MSGYSPASADRRTDLPVWSGSSTSGKRLPTTNCECTVSPPRSAFGRLARRGHREGEVAVGVDVPPIEPELRLLEHGLRASLRELVAALRPDPLARRDADLQPQPAEVDLLRAVGHEMHLDAGLRLVVEGEVTEGRGMEIGVHPPIDDLENVPVELRGDAARVVVGCLEQLDVLDQVEPHEESILAIPEQRAHFPEKAVPGRRLQVADRAAEKQHEPPAHWGRHVGEVPLEISDERAHLEVRIVGY